MPEDKNKTQQQTNIKMGINQVIAELSDGSNSVGVGSEQAGSDYYAAVDLGSNSFHLVISRYTHGEFTVIDRQREVVRLAAGLDEDSILSKEVTERALNALHRFGQLLRAIPDSQVRVVGTNALRKMHQKQVFLEAAEEALGQNIEIIAGREEARLIYLGVSKWSASEQDSRLVIDIGGGSTEIIVGRGELAYHRESLEVGCVTLSNEFFTDGKLTKKRFEDAKLAAELAIQPVVAQFRAQSWAHVIGCSGTMKSLEAVLIQGGWSKDGINRDALAQLLEAAIEAEHIDKLNFEGLTRDRKPVFAGGLSILLALFELFDIQQMAISDIALREGVLYDLVGRSSLEDIRNVTVSAMIQRWAIEPTHGEQVKATAIGLYQQLAASWDIQSPAFEKLLGWSAQLHELGLLISHDGYQHHGAYVVANADMAGFARRDQLVLAALIAGHRRKFPLDRFEQLPSNLVTPAKRIATLLRLAVLLHRDRSSNLEVSPILSVSGQQLELSFKPGWIADHPLTAADLAQERNRLKLIGVKLNFS